MKGIGDYLNVHATALGVRAKRNKVLASNIANAATPNFKARDLDFQAEIRKAEGCGAMSVTDTRHIKVGLKGHVVPSARQPGAGWQHCGNECRADGVFRKRHSLSDNPRVS